MVQVNLGRLGLAGLMMGMALVATAQAQTQPPSGRSSSISVLAPPHIDDYWINATLQQGGTIVFDGFAPDDATRQKLEGTNGADISWLKLGSGETPAYQSALDFGLSVLSHLSEGRFALRGNVVTLTGIAASAQDGAAIAQLLTQFPAGLVLADNEIAVPEVVPTTPYIWSVTKDSGVIALSGLVPTEAVQTFSELRLGQGANDETKIDPTAPDGFVQNVLAALDALALLENGNVSFDGSIWTVRGTAISGANADAIRSALSIAATPAANWTLAITATPVATPTPPVEEEPVTTQPVETPAEQPAIADKTKPEPQPEVVPSDPNYSFSATRNDAGPIILSGQVPTDPTLLYLGVVADAPVSGLTIATGAPDDFTASAVTGLRALVELTGGNLTFAAGKWALSGAAIDEQTRNSVLAAIAALPAGAAWSLDISAPPAVDACRDVLAEFSARNAILFQSGAAVITAESGAALDELAVDLAACPEAPVYVQGHTDADGDDQSNLALSVARAEAVVAALIERNIAAQRLYAIGYGESSPIADNDTPAGKRLNRRIVISVTDE